MATLEGIDGQSIQTEDLPNEWCDELVERVVAIEPVFDPLDDEDSDVDPAVFIAELVSYAKGLFGMRSKAPDPPIFFQDRGRIGHTAYWVYEVEGTDGDILYLFLLRKGAVTEIACGEKIVEYHTSDGANVIKTAELTPAQAALLEYCTMDFALPQPDPEDE